jgi:hypothetical protein
VSINRQGTLALVANRAEGTVSVFTIQGKTVAPSSVVRLGDEKSGPSQPAFTRDGRHALVTRDGDNFISVLNVDGTKVEHSKRDLSAGMRPYGLDVSADGSIAVVANIGRGQGDNDTVSVIDLQAQPFRVVETVVVGQRRASRCRRTGNHAVGDEQQQTARVALRASNKLLSPGGGARLVPRRRRGSGAGRRASPLRGRPDDPGRTVEKGSVCCGGRSVQDTVSIKTNGGAAIRTACA